MNQTAILTTKPTRPAGGTARTPMASDVGRNLPTATLQRDTATPANSIPRSITTAQQPVIPAARPQLDWHLPPLSPQQSEQMNDDVTFIVMRLKQGSLDKDDQSNILDKIERWANTATATVSLSSASDRSGTLFDHFLLRLKARSFSRSNYKTLWQDQYALAYDALWYELRENWRERFKQLVSRSKMLAGSGPENQDIENGARLLARQEAMGLWGMLKGMGTGLVGMAGPKAASAMAEQFDETARILFGEEWDKGEPLLLGMNAAQIGTAGGDIIWQLVTLARSLGAKGGRILDIAHKLEEFKKANQVLAVLGGVQGIGLSAQGLARVIEARRLAGLSVALPDLLQDNDVLDQIAMLASSLIGTATALKGGKPAPAQVVTRARVALLLGGLQTSIALKRLAEIAGSTMPQAEKTLAYGQVLTGLAPQLTSLLIDSRGLHEARQEAAKAPLPTSEVPPAASKAATDHPDAKAPLPTAEASPARTPTGRGPHPSLEEEPHASPAGTRQGSGLHVPDDMPNVMLINVSVEQLHALLNELEHATPTARDIARRIRSGELHVTFDADHVTPKAQGLAMPKEIHVTWGASIEATASTTIHEGAHHADPTLTKAPRSQVEATARVHEYEYNALRGLPPQDAAETIYRGVLAAAEKNGMEPAAAMARARDAMIDMMRADPEHYGIEKPAPITGKTGPATSPAMSAKPAAQPQAPAKPSSPSTKTAGAAKAGKKAKVSRPPTLREQLLSLRLPQYLKRQLLQHGEPMIKAYLEGDDKRRKAIADRMKLQDHVDRSLRNDKPLNKPVDFFEEGVPNTRTGLDDITADTSFHDLLDEAEKPTGTAERHEARTLGSALERMEIEAQIPKLKAQGYQAVYMGGDFKDVPELATLFSGSARPDFIAMDRTGKRLLIGDPTRSLQTMIPEEFGNGMRPHFNKTEQDYGNRVLALASSVPALAGYTVLVIDIAWSSNQQMDPKPIGKVRP